MLVLVAGIGREDGNVVFLQVAGGPGHSSESFRSGGLVIVNNRVHAASRSQHGGQQRLLLGVRIRGARGSGVAFGDAAR
jgi:hypothetical protein